MIHALIVVGTLLAAYVLCWAAEYMWNLLVAAPKAIYTGSIAGLGEISNRSQREIEALRKHAEAALQDKLHTIEEGNRRIAALEDTLSKRHPHDEHLESIVRLGVQKLDERERAQVRELLDVGTLHAGAFASGCYPDALVTKMGIRLFSHDAIRSSNGTELDRKYYINPEMKTALKNVLYPSRPVTPLQL